MLRLLAVLFMTELCSGFQPGFRYAYHANWIVNAGIPEINLNKKINSNISAELSVSIDKHYESITFQLTNVSMRTGADDTSLDVAFSLGSPSSYFRIDPKHGIYTNKLEGTEKNFYIGIASQIMPFLHNLTFWDRDLHPDQHNLSPLDEGVSSVTHRIESNVLGICPVIYTKRPLTKSEAYLHNVLHPAPICSADHGCQNIDDKLYLVKRFVDAKECKGNSYLENIQSTTRGRQTKGCSPDCGSDFTQYYQSSYYVRGSSRNARVDKIITSGTLDVGPAMRDGSEHFVSHSQSVFDLVPVEPVVQPHVPLEDGIQILYSPIADVADDDADSLEPLKHEKLSKAFDARYAGQDETEIASSITLYAGALSSRNMDDLNRLAHYPRKIKTQLSSLAVDSLQLVRKNLNTTDVRGLYYDILATTGTEAAVNELLDNSADWADREVLVDISMMVHLRSPKALLKLKEYILEQSNAIASKPFATSQKLVNFASVLRKYCKHERDSSTMGPPRDICSIRQEFIHKISDGLEKTNYFWMQMVYVKALVNLNTDISEILMPYIMNTKIVDTTVRLVAIDSFSSWNNADSEKVIPILFYLLENSMEEREVKARALGILSSHLLSTQDWNRLAKFTHRRGSEDLSALVYSLIKTTAEYELSSASSVQAARNALLLAKPASSAERYSSFYTWIKYCFRNQLTKVEHLTIVKNPTSPLPQNLAMVLRSQTVNGFIQSKMETVLSLGKGLDFLAMSLFQGRHHYAQAVKINEYEDWDHNSKDKKHSAQGEREGFFPKGLFSWVDSIGAEIFIPLDKSFLFDMSKSLPHDLKKYSIYRFLDQLGSHEIITFNEMGLPLRLQSSHPTSISFATSNPFAGDISPRKFLFQTTNDTHLLITDEYTSELELLLPNMKTIGVGFKERQTINLPLFYNILVEQNKHGYIPRSLSASIVKQVDSMKTEAYSYRNAPYIFTSSPSSILQGNQKTSEIYVSGNRPLQQDHKNLFKYIEYTFANDFVKSRPDEELLIKFIKYFTDRDGCNVLPNSLKFSSGSFVIDYGTKNPMAFHFNFTIAAMEQDAGVHHTGKHTSRSANRVFVDPKTLKDEIQEPISPLFQWHNHTNEPHLMDFMNYLRQLHVFKNEIGAMGVRLDVDEYQVLHPFNSWGMASGYFDGGNEFKPLTTKHFVGEALSAAAYNHSSRGEKLSFKTIAINLNNEKYCVDQVGTQPKLNNMDLHDDVLRKNLTKIVYTKVYSGEGCSLNILNLTETGRVSGQQLSLLLSQAKALGGNEQRLAHFHRSAVYDRWNKTVAMGHNLNGIVTLAYSIENAWNKIQSLFWKTNLAAPKMLTTVNRHYSTEFTRKEPLTWGIRGHSQYHRPVSSYKDGRYEEVQLDHKWLETSSFVTYESDYKFEESCIISPNMVKTFDGLSVPVNSSCMSTFTSFVHDWGNWRRKIAIMVLWREDTFEVKLVELDTKAKIFFKTSDLPYRLQVKDWTSNTDYYYLNSNESYWKKQKGYHGHFDTFKCEIFQQDGKFKIEIKDIGNVYIDRKEVRIALNENYRGYVGGLCGNWDKNSADDMQGPRGCPLHGPSDFQHAWYIPPQAFDRPALRDYDYYRPSAPTTEAPVPKIGACQRYIEPVECSNH